MSVILQAKVPDFNFVTVNGQEFLDFIDANLVLTRVLKLAEDGKVLKTHIKECQLGVAVGRYRNYPYAPTKALALKVIEVLREIWKNPIDQEDV